MCRRKRPDIELVRGGRNTLGEWELGRGGGRGVWWCREARCTQALGVAHVTRALRFAVFEDDVAVLRSLATEKRL